MEDIMKDEKKLSGDISIKKTPASAWFENFWYHYKWMTIGIVFAVAVVLICTLQMCSKESEDAFLVYAGPEYLNAESKQNIADGFEAVLPSDLNGDGEKLVILNSYMIYSEEQVKEIEADTTGYVDRSFNTQEYEAYGKYLLTGESAVFLLEPWLYESLAEADRLKPIDEVCDKTPKGAIDEYGVRLGDTDAYMEYDVLKALPADTVVCIMKPYVMGNTSKEKNYNKEKEVFKAIVEYESED